MKPVRGSGRASTRGPREAAERKMTKQKSHKRSVPGVAGSHPEASKKKSTLAGNSKAQGNWKPLSKSSILALENMLNMSILSVLTMRSKEKEESQQHLNVLKEQFLAKCAQLSVPPRKFGDIMRVSHQFKEESKKSEHGKKTVEALEENMSSIVSTLEKMEEQMDSLEEKCRIMRGKLEEEEESAKEFLQLSEQTVLCLPALPLHPANEPTLQEHIMKMVPNPTAVVKAFQRAPAVDDVRAFLELAHKQVDEVQAVHADSAMN